MKKTKDPLIFINPDDLKKGRDFTSEEKAILDLINAKVASGRNLGEIVDFFFETIHGIMSCDRVDVAFLENDNRRMVLYYVKTNYAPVFLKKGFASDIEGGSIQKVFQSGFPSIISDMEAHARNNPQSNSARLLVRERVKSSLVCPLIIEGRPVGMLMCRSQKGQAYSIHEARLHMEFAERLGQAMEKAYRIDQLSSAIQSYMEMLGFVSHELKNPLSSIIMLGKTLSLGYFGEIGERQREIVNQMVAKAEYLMNLTGEYLNLSRFESGEFKITPRTVDFYQDVIKHSLEIVASMITEKRIAFEWDIQDDCIKVTCDPELMKIVITNLLSNGIKYGNQGGRLNLIVSRKDGSIRVSVWNEGPGFPESEKIRLFRRFSKIQTPELMEIKGHGVGLYITAKIIELHGGRIWADSLHGEWAEFTFEIPGQPELNSHPLL